MEYGKMFVSGGKKSIILKCGVYKKYTNRKNRKNVDKTFVISEIYKLKLVQQPTIS
jgi:hypothetical protein